MPKKEKRHYHFDLRDKRLDIAELVMRETDGDDEENARITSAAQSTKGRKLSVHESLIGLSLVTVDGVGVGPIAGIELMGGWNTRTRNFVSALFMGINGVGDDETGPLLEKTVPMLSSTTPTASTGGSSFG